MNVRQMRTRCPDATPFGPLVLPNTVLRFRGVADVAYLRGAECQGGLWEISKRDEDALDRYEGVDLARPAWGLYSKKYLTLKIGGEVRRALYYMMNATGIMPPPQAYLDVIAQGYRDFGLDVERLQRAVDHSWARQRKTPWLRDRWKRKGMPRLGREVEKQEELPFDDQVACENEGCSAWIDPNEDYCPECDALQTAKFKLQVQEFALRRGR